MVTLGSIKSFGGFEAISLSLSRPPHKSELLFIIHPGKFHGVFSVKQVCLGSEGDTYLWLLRLPWEVKPYDEIMADRKAQFNKRWGIADTAISSKELAAELSKL